MNMTKEINIENLNRFFKLGFRDYFLIIVLIKYYYYFLLRRKQYMYTIGFSLLWTKLGVESKKFKRLNVSKMRKSGKEIVLTLDTASSAVCDTAELNGNKHLNMD